MIGNLEVVQIRPTKYYFVGQLLAIVILRRLEPGFDQQFGKPDRQQYITVRVRY